MFTSDTILCKRFNKSKSCWLSGDVVLNDLRLMLLALEQFSSNLMTALILTDVDTIFVEQFKVFGTDSISVSV